MDTMKKYFSVLHKERKKCTCKIQSHKRDSNRQSHRAPININTHIYNTEHDLCRIEGVNGGRLNR